MNLTAFFKTHRGADVLGAFALALFGAASVAFQGCHPNRVATSKQSQPKNRIVWAAMVGDLDLLKRIHSRGISLDYQDPEVYNWTPLMAAISFNQTNIIKYLLTQNINLNLQDKKGETALIRAVRMDDTNTVWFLLEKGADTTLKDSDGITAYGDAEGSTVPAVRSNLLEWLKPPKD